MNFRVFLPFFIMVWLQGCSGNDPSPGYAFKDQNLQGRIEGHTWVFQTGAADVEEDMLAVVLYDLEISLLNVCSPIVGVTSIFFIIPHQTGLYELANLATNSPVTVTYFSAGRQLNFITADGAIEVSTLSETGLTGRMDVTWPVYEGEFEGGHINGNFVIPICP